MIFIEFDKDIVLFSSYEISVINIKLFTNHLFTCLSDPVIQLSQLSPLAEGCQGELICLLLLFTRVCLYTY